MSSNGLPIWVVLLVAIIGGTGIAAIGGVITGFLKDKRVAVQQDRSVAIDEVDKAIPGLGEIIKQLRAQNAAQAKQIEDQNTEIQRLNRRNQELVGTVYNLEQRVAELERELRTHRDD